MPRVQVGNRVIYKHKNHHQVLNDWAAFRSNRNSPPILITFDHHTDFAQAYSRFFSDQSMKTTGNSFLPNDFHKWALDQAQTHLDSLRCLKTTKVAKATRDLSHDEHIDAAQRANIIDDVFLYQSDNARPNVSPFPPPQSRTIHHAPVIHMNPAGTAALTLEKCSLDQFVARIEATTGKLLESIDYILDVDMDVFRSERAASPNDPRTWHRFIRNAKLITAALEPKCVKMGLIDGEDTKAYKLFNIFAQHVSNA